MHIKITSKKNDQVMQHAFIRQARLDDAEQLARLDEGFLEEPDIDIPMDTASSVSDYLRAIVKALSSSRTSLFLVAEVDSQIVGSLKCTGYRHRAFRHVANMDIAIHKDFRGKRIGSALMDSTISWAKESSSIKRIELFVYRSNEVAIRLYKKFGFTIEGVREKGLCHRGSYVDYYMMALLLF